jgi:drug/metabolite transporter (DMT)-like permease
MPGTPISATEGQSNGLPLPVMIGAFCVLWSLAFSVAKIAIADCPPLIMLTVRFLIAGGIVLAWAAVLGGRRRLAMRDVAVFSVLGIANQAAYLGLSYVGMRTVSSGLTALIISANPVLTAIAASLVLGERMTWNKVLGLLLGLGGVAFIVQSRISSGVEHWDGIAFVLVALVSLVAGTILFKLLAPTGDLWIGNGVQSLAAGIALAPFALATEHVQDIVPTWRLLSAFVYMIVGVSLIAYLLWFQVLRTFGATAASSYYFVMPPLGMLFGWLLLGEQIEIADMLGIVPVALGIYLVTRPQDKSRELARA